MKDLKSAITLTLILMVVTGFGFPLTVWGFAQLLFPYQANGSFVTDADGKIVGSALIGQNFLQPRYFHPRPSAAGSGYDGGNSGGTNLGPTSKKLIEGIVDDPSTPTDETFLGIQDLARLYREENGLPADAPLPADAVTRSASGLDPHISPANAALQVERVAKARGVSAAQINQIVQGAIEPRLFGIFGERRINVLLLNLKLDRQLSLKAN